jgi:hypothetical protein
MNVHVQCNSCTDGISLNFFLHFKVCPVNQVHWIWQRIKCSIWWYAPSRRDMLLKRENSLSMSTYNVIHVLMVFHWIFFPTSKYVPSIGSCRSDRELSALSDDVLFVDGICSLREKILYECTRTMSFMWWRYSIEFFSYGKVCPVNRFTSIWKILKCSIWWCTPCWREMFTHPHPHPHTLTHPHPHPRSQLQTNRTTFVNIIGK